MLGCDGQNVNLKTPFLLYVLVHSFVCRGADFWLLSQPEPQCYLKTRNSCLEEAREQKERQEASISRLDFYNLWRTVGQGFYIPS